MWPIPGSGKRHLSQGPSSRHAPGSDDCHEDRESHARDQERRQNTPDDQRRMMGMILLLMMMLLLLMTMMNTPTDPSPQAHHTTGEGGIHQSVTPQYRAGVGVAGWHRPKRESVFFFFFLNPACRSIGDRAWKGSMGGRPLLLSGRFFHSLPSWPNSDSFCYWAGFVKQGDSTLSVRLLLIGVKLLGC